MAERPIVASAATGSLSSLLLWFLRESLSPRHPPPAPVPIVPSAPPPSFELECPAVWEFPKLDFWCGLLVGLILWPILELLVLCKQWLTLALRNRIAGLGGSPGKLYQVLG